MTITHDEIIEMADTFKEFDIQVELDKDLQELIDEMDKTTLDEGAKRMKDQLKPNYEGYITVHEKVAQVKANLEQVTDTRNALLSILEEYEEELKHV